jgi:hypothetical protein
VLDLEANQYPDCNRHKRSRHRERPCAASLVLNDSGEKHRSGYVIRQKKSDNTIPNPGSRNGFSSLLTAVAGTTPAEELSRSVSFRCRMAAVLLCAANRLVFNSLSLPGRGKGIIRPARSALFCAFLLTPLLARHIQSQYQDQLLYGKGKPCGAAF